MAAQDQTQATKAYRVTTLKQQGYKNSRMLTRGMRLTHILSESSKLSPTEYKKRHDKVATVVHWELCSFETAKHWYEHRLRAERVMENRNTKMLWNFNIRTNRVIEARRSDMCSFI